MERSRLEILVGSFVILALIILSFLVFFISGVFIFRQVKTFHVLFSYVSSVEKGSPVRFAGVLVGEVSDMELVYQNVNAAPQVKLSLSVDKEMEIREESRIRIEGIYGLSTPHVLIEPGDNAKARLIEPGETVRGVDPIPIDDLVVKGAAIADELRQAVGRVNEMIQDEELRTALKDTLLNLNTISGTLAKAMRSREEDLSQLIVNLESSTGRLKNILERMDRGEGTAGKLFTSEELYQEILSFVQDLKKHPWKLLKKSKEDNTRRWLFF